MKTHCDNCYKPISEDEVFDIPVSIGDKVYALDYCEECYNNVLGVLRS